MMKRTVIVDDDHLVRSYLKMLSSWERAGFQIDGEARDGEEALSMLSHMDIDLLVTDISMPLVNGIELIRELRRVNQRIYIIALSCHDEFEYVKDAMKEGADDYVLKNTLNEDSLYRLLEGVAGKMAEKERREQERERLELLARAGDRQLKFTYFSKVIGEDLSPEEEERERNRAGLRGPYRSCGVVSMRLERWEEADSGRRRYCQELLRRITETLRGEEGGKRLEAVYWGKGVFYGFVDLSDLRDGRAMRRELTGAALACARICSGEPHPFGVGVSGPCIGPEAVRTAYRQVNELMKLRFYLRQEILYYDAGRKTGTRVPEEARSLLERVEEYRLLGDRDRFLKACQEAGESFERALVDSRLVRQWLRALEQKAGISRSGEERDPAAMEEVYQRLREDGQLLYRAAPVPEGVSRAVSAAAEFVQDHYKEPVGLTEAALAAGLNPAYLSYLFHKEMEIGFSNFLLNRRIACAMELLSGTNLKIREVAEQSGFHDYHYFSKAFKKKTGLSPAEYRKRAAESSSGEAVCP